MLNKNLCISLLTSSILLVSSFDQGTIETNGKTLANSPDEKNDGINESNTNPSNADSTQNLNYELTIGSYTDKEIKINYPQITNLNDSQKQLIINNIIKNEALKVLNYYDNLEADLSLEINYEIKRKSAKLLSIQYSGVGYVKGAAHPNNIFYTTNINIQEGTRLRLKDMVMIDESFVEKFKEAGKALKPEFNDLLDEISNEDLIIKFSQADTLDTIGTENQSDSFSYLTNDALGISVSVSHALGDHAEFEIKYSDIESEMKIN